MFRFEGYRLWNMKYRIKVCVDSRTVRYDPLIIIWNFTIFKQAKKILRGLQYLPHFIVLLGPAVKKSQFRKKCHTKFLWFLWNKSSSWNGWNNNPDRITCWCLFCPFSRSPKSARYKIFSVPLCQFFWRSASKLSQTSAQNCILSVNVLRQTKCARYAYPSFTLLLST